MKLPFGGILVIASGDHLQLPEHFVRMTDELGQKVLRYMWNRPFDPQAVMEIEKCTFENSWEDLDDPCVMRVFGKRKAEPKEFQNHTQRVRSSGSEYQIFEATDEFCLSKSSV